MTNRKGPNNLPKTNRRLVASLKAGEKFRRAVHARVLVVGGGRSANRYGDPNPFRSFMGLLLSQIVATLAFACALTLKAEVSNGAEFGQTPAKIPASLDGANKAKALLVEAASLIGEGGTRKLWQRRGRLLPLTRSLQSGSPWNL